MPLRLFWSRIDGISSLNAPWPLGAFEDAVAEARSKLERCLDGDLSRNEAAPGCISERRELVPLRVAVPVFHGAPHAFPQPSRPHSDVCCPAGVSWHHERRRKRSPPSLHPPFTRSPFSFTRPHPNHPVHPVSLPFTLSRVYIIHAVHQHPLPHRFAIARHANTIEPQTLKSSPHPMMAIPPPDDPFQGVGWTH